MVALVIAAVGSFVSCKDYDDDINNLQKQIDTKAALSELTALQSTLDSKIAAAQSAAAAAQATADAAATKTALADLKSALETAIADAKKAGTDAGTKAGEAIVAANKAQETADAAAAAAKKAADDAEADLAAALVAINETFETKADADAKAKQAKDAIDAVNAALAAVKATADAAATQAQVTELKNELADLQSDLESSIDAKIAAAIAELDNASASVAAIWAAITGVELYGTFSGTTLNPGAGTLAFLHGTIDQSSLFGNNEDVSNQQGKPFVPYKAGDSIRVENVIIVKVSPVNATLTKDDIKLMDSEGNDLSDFVVIGEPTEFNNLITRASKTGLWQIPVKMKDTKNETEFNTETIVDFDEEVDNPAAAGVDKYKLYAVAVNNTADAAAGRFIATTFDLAAYSAEYVPATNLYFSVNGDAIATLKNRWDGTQIMAEDGAYSTKNPEMRWMTDAEAKTAKVTDLRPDTAANNGTIKVAAADVVTDARYTPATYKFVDVKVGEQFVIKMDAGQEKFVEWYYVVFDEANAIESAPSEIRAWQSYESDIEGLGVMTKSTDALKMKINAQKANHDIIGFRLYGVNYDGTLADPDGRAFYVRVGGAVAANAATIKDEATVEWKAIDAATATKNVSAVYELDLPEDGFETFATVAGTLTINPAADEWKDVVAKKIFATVNVNWQLMKTKTTAATNWNEAKFVKITSVSDPGEWLDEAVIPATIKAEDGNGVLINSIALNLKKVMPDHDATGISVKSGADWNATTNTLKIYMRPVANNTTTTISKYSEIAAYGYENLNNLFNLAAGSVWNFKFDDAGYKLNTGTTNEYVNDDINVAYAAAASNLYVPASSLEQTTDDDGKFQITTKTTTKNWLTKVGNGTAYDGHVQRIYAQISCRDVDSNGTIAAGERKIAYADDAMDMTVYFVDPVKEFQTLRWAKFQYTPGVKTSGATVLADWQASSGFAIQYPALTLNFAEEGIELSTLTAEDAKTGKGKKDGPVQEAGVYYADADCGLFGEALGGLTAKTGAQNDFTKLLVLENEILTAAVFNGKFPGQAGAGTTFGTGATNDGPFVYCGVTRGDDTVIRTFAVKITSNANGMEEYYEKAVLPAAGNEFTFNLKGTAATLSQDVPSKITITARTAFGNLVSYELPVTIKH